MDNGMTTIMFFWAMRCAPCLREMATMEELYRQHKSTGLTILGVEASGQSPAGIREILGRLKEISITASYPIVSDETSAISRKFGVQTTPWTFLIDKQGAMVFSYEGFTGERKKELLAAVEAVVEGRTIPLTKEIQALSPSPSQATVPMHDRKEDAASTKKSEEKIQDPIAAGGEGEEEFEKNRYFADFYFHQGDYERAVPCYLKATELDPKNIYVRLKLGEAFAKMKKFVEAREAWEAVLRLDPGNEEVDFNMRRLVRGGY